MRLYCLLPLAWLAACERPTDDPANHGPASNGQDHQESISQPPGSARDDPEPQAPVLAPAPLDAETGSETAVPAFLQGRWTGLDMPCADKAADLELTITPDRLVFHESVGKIRAVRQRADGGTMVDAAFTGEGQSWTRTLHLKPSADGSLLTIDHDGTAVTRKRC